MRAVAGSLRTAGLNFPELKFSDLKIFELKVSNLKFFRIEFFYLKVYDFFESTENEESWRDWSGEWGKELGGEGKGKMERGRRGRTAGVEEASVTFTVRSTSN